MPTFPVKFWMLSLTAVACLLAAGSACADQFQCLSRKDAAKAQAVLNKHPNILEFCEPCGDKSPGRPFRAENIKLTSAPDCTEITVNGKSIDLAYIFVENSPASYENLALKIGCPATNVSRTIDLGRQKPVEAANADRRRGAREKPDRADPAAAVSGNPYVGSWKGRGSDGYTYTFNFTRTEWDSAIAKQGVAIPLYKGSYTCTNSSVALKVTEEINTATMKWMPAKKTILLTGDYKNNVLTIPTITDAKLKK